MDIVQLQIDTPLAGPNGTVSRDAPAYRAARSTIASDLGTAFLDVARDRAGHPAVETNAGVFSYGWVLRAADSVRRYLCARPGHHAGARVVLQLANSPEYLAAFYGTLLADCVAVPLPVSLEAQRRQEIHELCRPDVLISRPGDSARNNTIPRSRCCDCPGTTVKRFLCLLHNGRATIWPCCCSPQVPWVRPKGLCSATAAFWPMPTRFSASFPFARKTEHWSSFRSVTRSATLSCKRMFCPAPRCSCVAS